MAELPEHGLLEETPLARLLIELLGAQFTGRFELRREHVEKGFLFDKGVPIFAESNLASESLGVQLLDSGAISRADYNKIVAQVERDGCKEGKALLEHRLIEPKALFLALKDQVRTRLIECFGWARGKFTIDRSVTPAADTQPFRSELLSLLQEGIETHWRVDRVLAELEPHLAEYPSRSSRLPRILERLQTDEALDAFVAALDGKETMWRAMQLATTPRAIAGAWVLDAMLGITYCASPEAEDETDAEVDVELVVAEAVSEAEPAPAASKRAVETRRPRRDAEAAPSPLQIEIDEKFANLESLDLYQLLDVSNDAEPEAIKAAYLRAAKLYHPDALSRARLSPDAVERASKVFGAIGKAYGTLSNPDRRRQYDARDSEQANFDAGRLANAEALYRKGEVLLRQGNFKGALEFLKPAAELWPDEADYQSALGWALYKKMPSEAEAAKEALEYAARLSEDDAIVLFRLSVVLRSLGETVAASTLQERARKLDPKVSS